MEKRLTLEMIEASHEIQAWLSQFPAHRRPAAINLLSQLRFVTRDRYAEWLKSTLARIDAAACGLYAVRKFRPAVTCLWNRRGITLPRPATSLGSEDLVQSVIAGLVRGNAARYQDHPSMTLIKRSKCFHAVLVDDASGSGDRICSFIRRMFSNKTFLSRWSFGWVRLHVVAYARTAESEKLMLDAIPGSDHGLCKYPKESKVSFHGHLRYHASELSSRWGRNAMQILDLCDATTAVPRDRRQGYGNTMSNIVFYHSVPNNIPGMLFCQNRRWKPLFPGRTVPEWLPALLERRRRPVRQIGNRAAAVIPEDVINLLVLIKQGRRTEVALARGIGFDQEVVRGLLSRAKTAGFINENNRLTEVGLQAILDHKKTVEGTAFDRTLYIPTKWCAGRGTVQPSGLGELARWERTESTSGSPRVDGGVGQTPLERTDAITAKPSLGVPTQDPSSAREGGDTHGPLG